MKLRLKKDIVILAGTIFDDSVPDYTSRDASGFVMRVLPFGKNATGELYVGHEMGDIGFKRWFEEVENK